MIPSPPTLLRRPAAARITTRQCVVLLLVSVLLALSAPVHALAAPSVVSGGRGTYVEQAPPTLIGEGLTVTGGGAYDGQYVEFAIGAGAPGEHLSLVTAATPSVAAGVVSVVGTAVYVGDGTEALPIGTVDPVRNGRDGQPLRVDLSNQFGNPGFETGDVTAWTPLSHRIDLGVTAIAGFTSQDTSTYPTSTPNSLSYPWTAPDGDDAAPRSASYSVQVTTSGSPTEGSYALRLESTGMTTAGGCDVVHGPAVYSGAFEAAAGDRIFFDWRAFAGGDAYHVFGYVVDDHGVQTEVLDAYTHDTSGSTNWATKETVIPATGSYRFVFVAGTFDATCGQAAGAQLLIDNVRVYGNKVDDAVVSSLGDLLQYENTSDDPPATRTVSVTARSQSNGTATGDITVDITPVDDPPSLTTPDSVTFTNTSGEDAFSSVLGTLTTTDPDSDTFVYDAAGATGSDWRVVEGTYADLRVHRAGGYVVEPKDAAIEAALTPQAETFTVVVTADGASDQRTLTVQVAIAASPPGAPTITTVSGGDRQAELAWSPGHWIGGSPTTDYTVEVSTDGGSTWTLVDDGVSSVAELTATDLVPGVAHQFRVAGVNASGPGAWSAVSDPVTPKAQQAPVAVDAGDLAYGTTAALDVLGGSGTGAVSYRVLSGPCVVEATTLATTDVGTCTLQAHKDGDTTYYPAEGQVTITVTPRPVTVDGATVVTRAYDGTTRAGIAGASLHGHLPGDDVVLTNDGEGTFDQAAVGSAVPVATSMGLAGDHAHRYVLAQPTLTGTIESRVLTVRGTGVATRVYDGTTDAVLTGATLAGVVPGEDVALTDHTTGTFGHPRASRVVPVATAMGLTGADSGNYALQQPELFGRIAERALQVVDAVVIPRVYDGTTAATVRGARLEGVVAGDHVVLRDAARGTYASTTPGGDIAVTTAIRLGGEDAGNYVLVQPDLVGAITARPLEVVGATVHPKVVNGGRAATIEGGTLAGVVEGDDVTLAGARIGTFDSAGVGDAIAVRTRMSLAGRDAGNYDLAQPSLVGQIVRAVTVQQHEVGPTGDVTDGPVADPSRAPVVAGRELTSRLCNVEPGSVVTVTMDATSEILGRAIAGEDGCADVTAVLPHHVSAGRHELRFHGRDLAGAPMTVTRAVDVEAAPVPDADPAPAPAPADTTGRLPATGTSVSSLVVLALVTLGLGLRLARRRPARRA